MIMIKWRQKHPSHPNYVKPEANDDDSGSDYASTDAKKGIDSVAASHRETVKSKDAIAKARKAKGRRRG